MAGLNVEAVLENIGTGHLECPICCCRFVEPKILNCLHSFCQRCLEKMFEAHGDNEEVKCPVCRKETAMPEAGIAGLLNNFSLMALVDEVTQQEELAKSQRSKITCELCTEDEEAVARCLECREYLCQECHKAHIRMKKTTDHCTASIQELQSGTVAFKSQLWNEVPKCNKHFSQDLIFYCETCMALICVTCAAVDHRAPDHEVCDLSAAITLCKDKVDDLVKVTEQHLAKLTEAKERVHVSYARHKNMPKEKHDIITQKADIVVARIRRNENLLKDKVTQICEERDRRFEEILTQHGESVAMAHDTLDRVKTVMAQVNNFDLLKLNQSLLKNLQDAAEINIPAHVKGLAFEDFQKSENFREAELDILFARKPLTGPEMATMMVAGTRVVRGQDWEWGNQDGYPPGEGIITKEVNDEGWVSVRWDRHRMTELNYRMGAEGKYDLQLVKQTFNDRPDQA